MTLRTRRLAPLSGTGLPTRGLFISRLAGLLVPVKGSSPRTIDAARFEPGVLDALFAAGQCGWTIYVCGNEDAVAKGKISEQAWNAFETELVAHLKGWGIPLKRHYGCIDAPDGKGARRNDSVFRFPNTGTFYHAQQEDGVELRSSWIVSGLEDELAAGWRAGLKCARVGEPARDPKLHVECERAGATAVEILQALVATQRAWT